MSGTEHDLTPQEILKLFGTSIVPVPVDQEELERIMAYVAKHGHQP